MIEINNLTNFIVDKKIFSTVAKKVLLGENRGIKTVSLAFVDKEEIKKLNKKYRKKNKPTDVLSFLINEKQYLGEIIICPEIVKENVPTAKQSRIHHGKAIGTKKYQSDFKRELLKVFIHGILHLCGYDHEKSKIMAEEMEKKQEKYLSNIK